MQEDLVMDCVNCKTRPDIIIKPPLENECRVKNKLHTIHISKQPNVELGIKLAVVDAFKPGDKGIFISTVLKDSLAEKSGIKIGDTVISINDQTVEGSDLDQVETLINSCKDEVSMVVITDGGSVVTRPKQQKQPAVNDVDVDINSLRTATEVTSRGNSKQQNETKKKSRLKDYVMVSDDLIGTVIGHKGSNIKLARNIRGVNAIKHFKCNEGHKVNIIGENENALAKARFLLELQKDSFMIPTKYAGRIIGKYRKNLDDIIAKSSVHKIAGREIDEGVTLEIIGKLEAVEEAKRLLNRHLEKLKHDDALIETWQDLKLQTDSIFIPSEHAGQIIGKYGRNLDDVIAKSSAVKIVRHQVDEGVNLEIIGKPEAVDHAKRLLTSHLDRFKYKRMLKEASSVCDFQNDCFKEHIDNAEQRTETSVNSIDKGEIKDVTVESTFVNRAANLINSCTDQTLMLDITTQENEGEKKHKEIKQEEHLTIKESRNSNSSLRGNVILSDCYKRTGKTADISKRGRRQSKVKYSLKYLFEEVKPIATAIERQGIQLGHFNDYNEEEYSTFSNDFKITDARTYFKPEDDIESQFGIFRKDVNCRLRKRERKCDKEISKEQSVRIALNIHNPLIDRFPKKLAKHRINKQRI